MANLSIYWTLLNCNLKVRDTVSKQKKDIRIRLFYSCTVIFHGCHNRLYALRPFYLTASSQRNLKSCERELFKHSGGSGRMSPLSGPSLQRGSACKRHPMHIHVTVQPLFIICLPLPAARPPRLTPAPAWQQSKSAGVIAQGHHSPVTASLLHSCHADRASHSNLSVVQTRLGRLFVRVSLVDALIMLKNFRYNVERIFMWRFHKFLWSEIVFCSRYSTLRLLAGERAVSVRRGRGAASCWVDAIPPPRPRRSAPRRALHVLVPHRLHRGTQ